MEHVHVFVLVVRRPVRRRLAWKKHRMVNSESMGWWNAVLAIVEGLHRACAVLSLGGAESL